MALRITQNMMYHDNVTYMNRNLANLMESNLQSSSQLKINRPSDDPLGAGRVVSYRASIDQLSRYKDNISAAKGWLGTADSIMSSSGSIMTVLTRIKELAEQASTETYDKMNRQEIAEELREQFNQLINIANTRFEGRSIFAGHKTDGSTYDLALGVTSHNETINNHPGINLTASGDTSKTAIIQFTSSGPLSAASTFRYSTDGGKNWQDGTVKITGADAELQCGGTTLKMTNGVGVQVDSVDPDNPNETDNGTWLYVRPSAVYNGDTNGVNVTTPYGSNIQPEVTGTFSRDVTVRIDSVKPGPPSDTYNYSYSLDDGNNWIQASTTDEKRIPVAGGFLDLSNGGPPVAGEQFVLHPYRADVNLAISDSDSITINMVGSEIFGGLVKAPNENEYKLAEMDPTKNLFDVCGRLVGAAEYGSPDDVAQCLEDLKDVMSHVASKAAVIGGRYNRISITSSALDMRVLDEQENLSRVEDVDVTELMTRLSMQQVAYNSVLKSSSMVMQMSLLNFL